MFKLTFLSSHVPLTKKFGRDGTKTSYPNVKNFSSVDLQTSSINEFYKHLYDMAFSKAKPCLLKGNLSAKLNNEPRKGGTRPNTQTHWICLDLDGAPFSTPDEFMRAIGLSQTSYVVQYSSSANMGKGLRCHIFCILSKPQTPDNLKSWLMHLNLHTPVLEQAIKLSEQQNHLKWPLDITTCQNDKLLYIAEPIFEDPSQNPLKPQARIQLVKRADLTLDVTKIHLSPIAKLRAQATTKRDDLRKAAGLAPTRTKTVIKDGFSILPNADPTTHNIVAEDDEFMRLNLGTGDSQAYYIIKSNPELIRNFKGEDYVYTKDVLPELYKHLTGEFHEANFTPSTNGDQVIYLREKTTGQYWKGLYNASTPSLDLDPVDSKDKLHDFLMGHGINPPAYIPEWRIVFNPQSTTVVDETNHILNRFVLPPLLSTAPATKPASSSSSYPIIQQALDSAVGTGQVQEHFLNWLAVIMQHRRKTRTAWILHGTQGTGKGIIFDEVIAKLLTRTYIESIGAAALSSDFDGWQENKLIVFIDEIEVDMFEKKSNVESKLKRMITERTEDIHRKGLTRYTVDSYTNYIFGSNKPHMVTVPPNDRRYNIGQYQSKRWLPTKEEIEVKLPLELPAFTHYLMTRKADIDLAGHVLDTEDRRMVQSLSVSSVDELANEILSGNLEKLADYLPDKFLAEHDLLTDTAKAYEHIIRKIVVDDMKTLTRDQLQIIFQHCVGKTSDSPHRFTKYLNHHGIVTKKIKQNGLPQNGIQIFWKISPETRADLLKRFKPLTELAKRKAA